MSRFAKQILTTGVAGTPSDHNQSTVFVLLLKVTGGGHAFRRRNGQSAARADCTVTLCHTLHPAGVYLEAATHPSVSKITGAFTRWNMRW